MEDSEVVRYPLNKKQNEIASADPNLSQLVLAPPGTGKTHTVIARIVYLVNSAGLDASNELLVLTFSRAASREITSRIRRMIDDDKVHDDLRFLTVRTFDSFATRLMLAADPEREFGDAGYDERIRNANDALEDETSKESHIVAQFKHLIVDEIQDLVGVRAELVRRLIENINGGFTLLGDPAQAIYDFSIKNDPDAMTSPELIDWAVSRNEGQTALRELERNYRSGGALQEFTGELRTSLQSGGSDHTALDRLTELIGQLESAGSAADLQVNPSNEKSVCILCRNNGEVLQLASRLESRGEEFTLKPHSGEFGLPPWIARMFSTWDDSRITRKDFYSRWADLVAKGRERVPDSEQAWSWLKRIDQHDGRDLDVNGLRSTLYKGGRLPDEADEYLSGAADDELSISTIHSSKGREFDHVVVLDPDRGFQTEAPAEEGRVLYVAATRARERLERLDRKGVQRIWNRELPSGRTRWISSTWNNRGQFYFMEVGAEADFDPKSTVSNYLYPTQEDAEQVQNYIWERLDRRSIVKVKRVQKGKFSFFQVFHESDSGDETLVGQLSLGFKNDLRDVLKDITKGGRFSYPRYMDNIRIAAVVTEVLKPYPENVHLPFRDSGFCLGLRVRGMGYIHLEGKK